MKYYSENAIKRLLTETDLADFATGTPEEYLEDVPSIEIGWHTGTPTEEGLYLVYSHIDGYCVEYFGDDKWFDSDVVCEAWQKITPYEASTSEEKK